MTKTKLAIAALLLFAIASCSDDTGARKDLPQENQDLDSTTAQIFLFPDQFPNVAHKCDEFTGIWTTADRAVWIVYDDPKCGAPLGEGRKPIVLTNIPGSNSGGGEG